MTKAELISIIAKAAGITKDKAAKSLNAYEATVTKELRKRGKIVLVGFGTFSVVKKQSRTGRNPQTGKAIKISAKKVVKFKAGKTLQCRKGRPDPPPRREK
jgi:DNA-binding protein HU-beta